LHKTSFAADTAPGPIWPTRSILDYHDHEWGVPCHDENRLFEMLNLEGAQAGLSWETILNKRANYRAAFDDWDAEKIAAYGPEESGRTAGQSRHRAQQAESGCRDHQRPGLPAPARRRRHARRLPVGLGRRQADHQQLEEGRTPAKTELSDRLSKDLAKRGFKFVGSTIVYAYMQGIGMVDDHEIHFDIVGTRQRGDDDTAAAFFRQCDPVVAQIGDCFDIARITQAMTVQYAAFQIHGQQRGGAIDDSDQLLAIGIEGQAGKIAIDAGNHARIDIHPVILQRQTAGPYKRCCLRTDHGPPAVELIVDMVEAHANVNGESEHNQQRSGQQPAQCVWKKKSEGVCRLDGFQQMS
jgi:DNA-3-methyladenine glycosylase I